LSAYIQNHRYGLVVYIFMYTMLISSLPAYISRPASNRIGDEIHGV